jgi:hypothetical protein
VKLEHVESPSPHKEEKKQRKRRYNVKRIDLVQRRLLL